MDLNNEMGAQVYVIGKKNCLGGSLMMATQSFIEHGDKY